MASFLYTTVLALLLLLTSKGLAEMAEDRELENLLASLEEDSVTKPEEPQYPVPDTTMDFPEALIDNVDHMKEERKLSGLENPPNENTEDDDKLAIAAFYEPVGCYRDYGGNNRPLPVFLASLRSQIDWKDLNKTIRACALLAKAKGYTYFAIQFYGECWSGPTADQTYNKDGPSDRCVAGVGQTWTNFVYRFKADECSKYIELNSKERSDNNNGADGIFRCDSNLPLGWYRFTGPAGTYMANKCPPRFHCGTHAPGWMSGTLPSKVEGTVNRTVCFHWRNDCCYWDTTIMVKNCGAYYIYKLQKPPYCRLKYCGSSTSAKKRTYTVADIPDTTTTGLQGPAHGIADIPDTTTTGLQGPAHGIADIPDTTTTGLQRPAHDNLADQDAGRPKDGTSRSLNEDTEMNMFLGNGNDDVLDEYEQVGCYRDRGGANRPLPILLADLRPQIDWHNLNKTVRACASIAQGKGYHYFGIQFYGECWSGPDANQTYDKDGASPDGCAGGVGKAGSNYVYRFVEEKTTVSPTTSGKPLPVECTQYTELKSAERSVNYGASGTYTCDSNLTLGWYRFTGQAGTHMVTKCPPRFHCGAHAPGWMKGTLPSKADGSVSRKVCFHWRKECCHWDTTTLVRNCGGYYVYRLQKPPVCRLKYCGNGKEPSTEEPTTTAETTEATTSVRPRTTQPTTTEVATPHPGDECTNYDELNSADRSENHGPNGIFTCDKDLTPGWYRFSGQAGTQMATKCPQILQCGTHAPGWMSGTLPSVAEGVVERKVCFHWKDDCCYFDTKVSVRNCGGFFVYNLPKPPLCRLKYCGSKPAFPTTNKPMTTLPPTRPPMPKKTFRLCEHRSGVLRCPPGQKIKIRYANYGRTEGRRVCPHRSIRTTHCYSSVAASLIRCACNGHNSCPLYAKNQVYGDPCVGTFKYIEVKYQCLMQSMEDFAMR